MKELYCLNSKVEFSIGNTILTGTIVGIENLITEESRYFIQTCDSDSGYYLINRTEDKIIRLIDGNKITNTSIDCNLCPLRDYEVCDYCSSLPNSSIKLPHYLIDDKIKEEQYIYVIYGIYYSSALEIINDISDFDINKLSVAAKRVYSKVNAESDSISYLTRLYIDEYHLPIRFNLHKRNLYPIKSGNIKLYRSSILIKNYCNFCIFKNCSTCKIKELCQK